MLKYYQSILSKVSFNQELFLKELNKAKEVLVPTEYIVLKEWVLQNYSALLLQV